ncbi:MarR family transcriptional regulator [Nocardioides panacisoli]|uniref:MarR family transcriptional regulator n=1 Tax=Nocardioides panacisoli TaxID=627624 RepID=UPI001C635BB1|nr:MarR family transcriptional regulator [Nocardioides panacisoli]QYJ04271.1 MarR family transcriptional regulator [Nocardioides panacisoli]
MTAPDLDELSSDLVVYAARLVRTVRHEVPHPATTRVLSLLDQHGPLGVTALADADRCSQPTMTGAVRQLVDRGWVTKQRHPEDARASLVALTTAGRRELRRVRESNGRLVADRITADGRHDAADVATAVAVLRDLLERPEGDATP